jgi:acetyltransferase
MSTYRLDRLFNPRSVALVGTSPRENSVGRIVLRNLRMGGFAGALHVVNPFHAEIEGLRTVKSLGALAEAPDVVVVTAPPATLPAIIGEAGAKGCAVAIVITAGLGHGPGSLAEQMCQAARGYGLRIVGPNGLGVMAPRANFNASFARHAPALGDLAFISQSGALAAGLVEWAARRHVGFSAVVSIGDAVEVDFGDLLDYFALDPRTRSILLYIESIVDAAKFMSAARAASRTKPVVVIKAGRHEQGARAAATHTGALAGSDAVYDAAFRRAGLLRVFDLDELFAATETLGRQRPFPGRRLAMLTNGGGVGVLAVDRLNDLGGTLAGISAETFARLDAVLPPGWSRANPVDIIGDADGARYRAALAPLLADPENDAVLVMNVPTALASPLGAARAVIEEITLQRARRWPSKPVFAVWIGDDPEGIEAFSRASVPFYPNEAEAVRGFMHLVRYREAIDGLMETPPSLPETFSPDRAAARAVVDETLVQGQVWLDPIQTGRLFAAYDIPLVPALLAKNADEAAKLAAPWVNNGTPVVIKILSPDIVHKSEVGGVRLNLTSVAAVREAAADVLARACAMRSDARISGVTIHPMIIRPKARELIAGMAEDPTFGPVIVFGRGGTAVEVINDKALSLPPLDLKLAYDLIARTRVSRVLKAYRDVPAADLEAVAMVLVKIAQMAVDLPELHELDVNPLLADKDGVIAVDARVAVAPLTKEDRRRSRFAVKPYPREWQRRLTLRDGRNVLVRPIRPEDEPLVRSFFQGVKGDDLRLRFFAPVKDFSHPFIARLTQIDYARAIAFVALDQTSGQMLGAVHLHINVNLDAGEYAILVRSDLKGHGLGWALMQLMIEYAKAQKLERVTGQVLRENTTMLQMCEQLGFDIAPDSESADICTVTLSLQTP